jgi:hypothetical protein
MRLLAATYAPHSIPFPWVFWGWRQLKWWGKKNSQVVDEETAAKLGGSKPRKVEEAHPRALTSNGQPGGVRVIG